MEALFIMSFDCFADNDGGSVGEQYYSMLMPNVGCYITFGILMSQDSGEGALDEVIFMQ